MMDIKDGIYPIVNELTGEVEYEVIVNHRVIHTVKGRAKAEELLLLAKAAISG